MEKSLKIEKVGVFMGMVNRSGGVDELYILVPVSEEMMEWTVRRAEAEGLSVGRYVAKLVVEERAKQDEYRRWTKV